MRRRLRRHTGGVPATVLLGFCGGRFGVHALPHPQIQEEEEEDKPRPTVIKEENAKPANASASPTPPTEDQIVVQAPTSSPTCQPTPISWKGGIPPYSLTFQTALGYYGESLRFSPINSHKLDAPVYFSTGSRVFAILADSTGKMAPSHVFNITSGNSTACVVAFSPLATPAATLASKTSKAAASSNETKSLTITRPAQGDTVKSCTPNTFFAWEGGVPPYSLSIKSLNETGWVQQAFSNITGKSITTSIHITPGVDIQVMVNDSTGISSTSPKFPLSGGKDERCLLANFGTLVDNKSKDAGTGNKSVDVKILVPLCIVAIFLVMVPCAVHMFIRYRTRTKGDDEDGSGGDGKRRRGRKGGNNAVVPRWPSDTSSVGSVPSIAKKVEPYEYDAEDEQQPARTLPSILLRNGSNASGKSVASLPSGPKNGNVPAPPINRSASQQSKAPTSASAARLDGKEEGHNNDHDHDGHSSDGDEMRDIPLSPPLSIAPRNLDLHPHTPPSEPVHKQKTLNLNDDPLYLPPGKALILPAEPPAPPPPATKGGYQIANRDTMYDSILGAYEVELGYAPAKQKEDVKADRDAESVPNSPSPTETHAPGEKDGKGLELWKALHGDSAPPPKLKAHANGHHHHDHDDGQDLELPRPSSPRSAVATPTSGRRAVYHFDGGHVEEVIEFPPAYPYARKHGQKTPRTPQTGGTGAGGFPSPGSVYDDEEWEDEKFDGRAWGDEKDMTSHSFGLGALATLGGREKELRDGMGLNVTSPVPAGVKYDYDDVPSPSYVEREDLFHVPPSPMPSALTPGGGRVSPKSPSFGGQLQAPLSAGVRTHSPLAQSTVPTREDEKDNVPPAGPGPLRIPASVTRYQLSDG